MVPIFCAVVAIDRTTSAKWESPYRNGKRPRPPTPSHETVAVSPSTAITFQLRHWVHAGTSYMLFPIVAYFRCLRLLVENCSDMVVAAKVHSGIESWLCGVCTLAIGNGVWW